MTKETKSPAALVLLAWLFVGIPLGWGVYNTVRNSMKLFQKPSPPAHASVIKAPVPNRPCRPEQDPGVIPSIAAFQAEREPALS